MTPTRPAVETAPEEGVVRIGIELEGVGSVDMKWGERPTRFPRFKDTPEGREAAEAVQSTLKQTSLIRSNSFTEEGFRGVSIMPEEALKPREKVSTSQLGKSHLAELVSRPHELEAPALESLRNSVRSAFSQGGPMRKRGIGYEFDVPDGGASGGPDGASILGGLTVESSWTVNSAAVAKFGSLQTTVGVCVESLCSNNPKTRRRVVEYLVSDLKKRERLIKLLGAAAQGQLVLIGHVDEERAVRLRLVLLMYLINTLAPLMKGGGYEKDAFGCNIKGFSSILGCGGSAQDLAAIDEAKSGVVVRQSAPLALVVSRLLCKR